MRQLPLTRDQVALVDGADFDWLSQWKWYAQANGRGGFYAARREGDRLIYMHAFIMESCGSLIADHRDGNGLNNQRANLRPATPLQNMMNRSGKVGGTSRFKGVWFDRHQSGENKWRSGIRLNGKIKYLGRFANEEDAGAAYAAAATEHFGEFANTTKGAPQ